MKEVLSDADGHLSPVCKELIEKNVTVGKNAYEVADGAHAIAVLTEWDEFRTLDFERIHAAMLKPAFVFDGRNLLDTGQLTRLGFEVHSVGKGRSD